MSIKVMRADGSVEIHNPADEVPQIASIAARDVAVAETLRLLAKSDKDWVNLYRVYEVVSQDMGGDDPLVKSGWVSRPALRQFKHTANSPGAIGHEARHGVDSGQPPPVPMSIGDARGLIGDIVQKWVRAKV